MFLGPTIASSHLEEQRGVGGAEYITPKKIYKNLIYKSCEKKKKSRWSEITITETTDPQKWKGAGVASFKIQTSSSLLISNSLLICLINYVFDSWDISQLARVNWKLLINNLTALLNKEAWIYCIDSCSLFKTLEQLNDDSDDDNDDERLVSFLWKDFQHIIKWDNTRYKEERHFSQMTQDAKLLTTPPPGHTHIPTAYQLPAAGKVSPLCHGGI